MSKISGRILVAISVIAVLLLFFSTSCEKADTATTIKNPSQLQLYLTDAPLDYDAVWIDIQQVMVHLSGDTTRQSGWQELPVLHPGKYNLLDLRNGNDTLLVSSKVPPGKLLEIRLLLGDRNTITLKDGSTRDLLIPSGEQSKINLKVENIILQPETTFDLVLDFDLAKSIREPVVPDSGQYILQPTIHLFAKGAAASIEGWVAPDSAQAHVLAISPFHDTLTAIPDVPGGFFRFWGIPEGSYDLYFIADPATGYKDDTLLNIQAIQQERVKTDTIFLQKHPLKSD